MKSFVSSVAAAIALAGPAVAFPALTPELASDLARRQALAPQGVGFLPVAPPPFDAAAQYISTSGQYAFVPPTSTDARGECPGLNAMANHGYLPHNGFATIEQFIDATQTVFGMARDLGGFLAIYGAIVDGPGFGWSIEGVPHYGIAGSHGNYEADSSPMKSDLNQYGSNERLILEQFHELYDMQPNAATANYNLEVLRTFRGIRFAESVNKNPYFTYNPFAGIEVSQAAFTFIYRFMANKSAEYPEGILNKNVLKSFMAISGPENNLKWTKGYERIPDNWYKRNPTDEYSIPYFEADILSFAATQPEILDVGCNMGTVNSYNSISPQTLSNGAYDANAVASNPFCYGLAFAQAQGAAQLGLNSSQTAAFSNFINPLMASNNCTSFKNGGNTTALLVCPGASVYGGPLGPVAPGAIQNN